VSEVIWADGRTDWHGEANRYFSRFALVRLTQFMIGRAVAGAVSSWLLATKSNFDVRLVHMGFVVDQVTLGRGNLCYSLCTQERLTNKSWIVVLFFTHRDTAPWLFQRRMTWKLMFLLAFYSLFPWQQVTEEKWVTMSSRWRSSIDNVTACRVSPSQVIRPPAHTSARWHCLASYKGLWTVYRSLNFKRKIKRMRKPYVRVLTVLY
jgi:hypothetical protein